MLERLKTEVSAYSATWAASGWRASHDSHEPCSLPSAPASGQTTVSFASPNGTDRGAATRPSNGWLRPQPSRIAWSRSSRPWPTLAITDRVWSAGPASSAAVRRSSARSPRMSSKALCQRLSIVYGWGWWSSASSTIAAPMSVSPLMWSASMWLTIARSIRSASFGARAGAQLRRAAGAGSSPTSLTGPPSIRHSRSPACSSSESPWKACRTSSEKTTAHTAWIARRASTTPLPWK